MWTEFPCETNASSTTGWERIYRLRGWSTWESHKRKQAGWPRHYTNPTTYEENRNSVELKRLKMREKRRVKERVQNQFKEDVHAFAEWIREEVNQREFKPLSPELVDNLIVRLHAVMFKNKKVTDGKTFVEEYRHALREELTNTDLAPAYKAPSPKSNQADEVRKNARKCIEWAYRTWKTDVITFPYNYHADTKYENCINDVSRQWARSASNVLSSRSEKICEVFSGEARISSER